MRLPGRQLQRSPFVAVVTGIYIYIYTSPFFTFYTKYLDLLAAFGMRLLQDTHTQTATVSGRSWWVFNTRVQLT